MGATLQTITIPVRLRLIEFAIYMIVQSALTVAFAASENDQVVMSQQQINQFLAAAATNNIDDLAKGLEQGVAVDSQDGRGRTALLIATHENAIDAARYLIEHGADVNKKDQMQDSPYLYAGAEGKIEILKLTIAAGADLSSTNRYGGTALIPAAHHGHVDIVRYLLTTDTDIDHINDIGWTALLEAVILGDGSNQYQSIVKALLQSGADRLIPDNDGVTALEHAKHKKFTALVKLLE